MKEKCSCGLCNMIEKTTWVSVKDRLPIQDQNVLCIDKEMRMYTARYERIEVRYSPGYVDKWNHDFCCGREPGDPTHWMPLPNPPEEK